MKKIFISCVSSEFKSLRLDAALALKRHYEPVFQEDFNFEPKSLKETLRKKIKGCHGILHIVGYGYGAGFPSDDPECNPNGNISYTQWELRMVEAINRKSWRKKRIWLVFPEPDCTRDTDVSQLDRVESPEITEEESAEIQAMRRQLQAEYRDSLLLARNKYSYRKPRNDQEFRKVLDALVKTEKRKQHVFASLMTALMLVAIGAGYWGFNELSERGFNKQVDDLKRSTAKDPRFRKPKYLEVANQDLMMGSLLWDSFEQIHQRDERLWKDCIRALDKADAKQTEPDSRIDPLRQEMLRGVVDPKCKALIERSVTGYAFLVGAFDKAAETARAFDNGLARSQQLQCLFEIHYNRYHVAAAGKTSEKTRRSIEAINDALNTLEAMDPQCEELSRVEFDGLELLYVKAELQLSMPDNGAVTDAVRDTGTRLLSGAGCMTAEVPVDFAMRPAGAPGSRTPATHGLNRKQIGAFYAGLGHRILGKVDFRECRDIRNLDEGVRKEKLNHALESYGKAVELLNAGPASGSADDEKAALTERGAIYDEMTPLYEMRSGNLLDDLQGRTAGFKRKVNEYKRRADKMDLGWKNDFAVEKSLYQEFIGNWDSDWELLESSWLAVSNAALEIAGQLESRYSGESRQMQVAQKDRALSTALGARKDKRKEYMLAQEDALDDAKALDGVELPKEEKPVIVRRNLTAIEDCLRELDIPNLGGAKNCIAKLDALVKTGAKDPKEKQDAAELSLLIKNVFTAEANLSAAKKGIITAENEAALKEERANDYLKPNSFGTVRTEPARIHMQEAEALRRNATERLASARESVLEQLRQTAKAAGIYHDNDQNRGAAVLAGVVYAVMKRSETDFQGEIPMTEEEVVRIKNEGKTIEGVIPGK